MGRPKRWNNAVFRIAFWLVTLMVLGCGWGGGATAYADERAVPGQYALPLTIPDGYVIAWADEFANSGLPDASHWQHDTGRNKAGWHNHELQYYSKDRLANAQVRDGKLIITARKEQMSAQADWGGQQYSSARLITAERREWTYGFFEIRAKLPCGKGTWPAIWMLGSQGAWPAGGELDIMEQVGSNPARVFSTVHTTSGSGDHGAGEAVQVADACLAFHNYQMDWTAQQVRFGIDGRTHLIYRNSGSGHDQWPFDLPQFLILNLAIGGDLGGTVDDEIFPVRMEVDYVRVYQRGH
jgi:beta-glucanase (GH16 family)